MDIFNSYIKDLCDKVKTFTPAEAAAYDAEIKKREEMQQAEEKIARYKKSGAPERYWPEALATYKAESEMQKTAAAAAGRFVHSVKCGDFKTLVLIGNAGTGKTHLSCGIVREVGGKYRIAPDIVEEMRRAKAFNAAETEADIIEYYGQVKLLVIDEIGRGFDATSEKYMLYQILNARYNTRRPTVLISNHKKADFLQYIGAAAADRLLESAEVIELNGESYRRIIRRENGKSASN